MHWSKCKHDTVAPMTRSFSSLASPAASMLVFAVVCLFHFVFVRDTSRLLLHCQTENLPGHRLRRHFQLYFAIFILFSFSLNVFGCCFQYSCIFLLHKFVSFFLITACVGWNDCHLHSKASMNSAAHANGAPGPGEDCSKQICVHTVFQIKM